MFFSFPVILSANNSPSVVINEIAWMGTGNSSADEWIELYNTMGSEINLEGWTLKGSDGLPNISLSGLIPAQGYYLIERTDDKTVPEIAADLVATFGSDSGAGLSNDPGETLELRNGSSLIDSASWTKTGPGDPSTKQTMERKNAVLPGNEPANWQTSQNPGGTPKAQNSTGATQENNQEQPPTSSQPIGQTSSTSTNQPPKAEAGPDLVALINQEINFDGTKSSDPENQPLTYFWNFGDGATSDKQKITHAYKYPGTYIVSLTVNDGTSANNDTAIITIYSNSIFISEFIPNPTGTDKENEWIEIYNNSEQIANFSSWQLTSQDGKDKFAFPANTLIAGQQYLILPAQLTKLPLKNDSSSLKLLYPNGQTAQEIKYEKPKQGQSIALSGNGQYLWTTTPTPGLPNIITNLTKTTEDGPPLKGAVFNTQENSNSQTVLIQNENYPNPPAEGTLVTAGQITNNPSGAPADNNSATLVNKVGNVSSPQPNQQNVKQEKTASLADKIFSSPFSIILIILLAASAGLGLVKIKRKLKSRALKTPIDWQD